MKTNLTSIFKKKQSCSPGTRFLRMAFLFHLLLVLQLGFTTRSFGAIIYVDADAGGSNNGGSWANAYTSLQSALDVATSGDEIWVAAGTYKPESAYDLTNEDRYFHFRMIEGVAIYGGFAGGETTLDGRSDYGEGGTNETILSGDIGTENDSIDNCYHVFYHPDTLGLTASAILDGFTITGGNADDGNGGGMYNNSSSPTLDNIIFSNNNSKYGGGGMSNSYSSPTLINVTFRGNTATAVGAGFGGGMSNSYSSPTLTNVTFSGNTADSGGGMFNGDNSSPTLTNIAFNGNTATNSGGGDGYGPGGGGGMVNLSSSPMLTNVTFNGNTSFYFGGGMANLSSSPTLTNVTFSENTADSGGGMYNNSSSPMLSSVIFIENSAFTGGGGIYNDSSSPTLTNVTLSGNIVQYDGGGMYNTSSSPTLNNCILWGNGAGSSNGDQIYISGTGTTTLNYSCYSNETGDISGTLTEGDGNITSDPLFVDAANGDYRIYGNSPCVDAGNNSYNTETTDIRGEARIQNTTIDIGAYEWTDGVEPSPPLAVTTAEVTTFDHASATMGGEVTSDGGSTVTGRGVVYNTAGNPTLLNTQVEIGSGTGIFLQEVTGLSASTTYYVKAYAINATDTVYGSEQSFTTYAIPVTYYVNDDATGANDGSTWTDAFTSLQSALDTVSVGDQIWVAAGTYKPSSTYDLGETDPRYPHFRMVEGVAIYGGFAGGETTLDGRNDYGEGGAYETILSGDIGTENDSTDNCYHVFYHPDTLGLTASAVLDGFTITGGNADGTAGGISNVGGGMYNNSSSPTLRNITFSGNTANTYGGGMYNDDSSPTLTNVTFSGNSVNTYGGGMYNDDSSPTLTNVIFSENTTNLYGYGGGMSNMSSSPILTNVTFSGNVSGNGGGMFSVSSSPTLTSVIFSENTANLYGGGMYNQSSSPTLRNITFNGNTANTNGGGMYNSSSSPKLNNCILWGNTANSGGNQIYIQGTGTTTLNYTCYSNETGDIGGGTITEGTGNITSDPLFVDTANGDFRIYGNSPCVDAGNNSDNTEAKDIRGEARIQNNTIDIGAYEWTTGVDPDYAPMAVTTAAVTTYDHASATMGGEVTSDGGGTVSDRGVVYNTTGNPTLTLSDTKVEIGSGTGIFSQEVTGLSASTTYYVKGYAINATDTVYGSEESFTTYAIPVTYYVDVDATGNNDGSTWTDAFASLQSALNSVSVGDQIWVAAGTYNPESAYDLTNTSRYYHFRMVEGVAIYGGFAGTETAVEDRTDFGEGGANETILSGDIGTPNDSTDNCYHVFLHPDTLGLTTNAILDGFTITGGNADGAAMYYYGGGMFNFSSSPALSNITFSGNSANSVGGMYNNSSSPTLTNVSFIGNTASLASGSGGMHNQDSSPILTNVQFIGNSGYSGGGMSNSYSSPTLTNVLFRDNTAVLSGGGMVNFAGSPILTNVIFSGNSVTYVGGLGGGMYNYSSSSPILNNCIFWGNIATSGRQIHIDGGTTTLNYSCYSNEAGDISGTITEGDGNITSDPLFIDAANGDFRLYGNSPCVDAGNNDANTATTDVRGEARIQNGTIDMGSYEWTTSVDPASSPMAVTTAAVTTYDHASATMGGEVTSDGGSTVTDRGVVYNTTGNPILTLSDTKVAIGSGTGIFSQEETGLNYSTTYYVKAYVINATDTVYGSEQSFTTYAIPVTYYVNDDATGANNGENWDNAFTSLQSALDLAAPGDQIWVAKGIYTPESTYDLMDSEPRFRHFRMVEGVAIYGGFAGDEETVDERSDFGEGSANETILSGDIGTENDSTDNCYHLFFHPDTLGLTASAILDGFTITGGNADGTGHAFGGGMYNNSSSPALTNVTFSGNTANYSGGGMYNNSSSSPILASVRFSGNTATWGGGMYNNSSSPTLTNVTFSGNTVNNLGGGMYNESSSPILTNITFSENNADSSGGGMFNESFSPILTNVTFSGNSAGFGGGMSNYSSSPTLTNVTFSGNTANSSGGGVLNYSSSSPTLNNCILWGNTASSGGDQIYQEEGSTTTLNYSCFSNGTNDISGTITEGDGNITSDPQFIDAANGNLRIYGISPCVDAGNNSDNTEAKDIRGEVRIQNSTIDMGAYEWTDGVDPKCATESIHLYSNDVLVDVYCSIQEAIDASQDGDSIYMEAGVYTEQLTITTGIVIQGAGSGQTTIESPNAENLSVNGGNWKNLKNQDVFAIIGIKTNTDTPVKIKGLTVDGRNQGYQPDVAYPDKMTYTFQGIGAINSNLLVDDVKITQVRTLSTDPVPSGYDPTEQPSGMNHNESIFAESAEGEGSHTLEISNTYIDKFQKTAILAWGPTLTVDIHDNTIQGYGQTLWSTGNGIQVGSSDYSGSGGGDRRGTSGSVSNNQILEIGLVIPEPGEDGSYLNTGMYSSCGILLWETKEGFTISGNTIKRDIQTKSWHVDFTSADGGYGSTGIDIVSSQGVIIRDNILEGYDEAIALEKSTVESTAVMSNNTVSNNTIDYGSFSGPNNISFTNNDEVLTYYTNSPGNDTLSNFSLGDSIWIVDLTSGVVNGLLSDNPSIDYTSGTISEGDGTNVGALSMQVESGENTYLYMDTDNSAGAAELKLILKGAYIPSNFYFDDGYIIYQYALPEVTTSAVSDFGATIATLGGEVTNDGGTEVTEQGIVYSSSDISPEIGETDVIKEVIGSGTGMFNEEISSLTPGETYYVRAYATTLVGTNYGEVESFTTYNLPDAQCQNIDIELNADGSAIIDSSSVDNGSTAEAGIKTIELSNYNFSCSDIGANDITLTVTDEIGNTAQCISVITVDDKIVPVFTPIEDVSEQLSAGECETTINYPAINVSDNCGSVTPVLLSGLGSDGIFPIGTTTETWQATDSNGNKSELSFDVVVTPGNSAPSINAISDVIWDGTVPSLTVPLSGISGGNDCTPQDVEISAIAESDILISSLTVHYEGGETGELELFFTNVLSGSTQVTLTLTDSEGAVTTESFRVSKGISGGSGPYLVDTVANQMVNAPDELKISISSELGVLFDDPDDASLGLYIVEEGTDTLPSWAVYENDTLYCTPMIADTGCVNFVVTAFDEFGSTASDTFQVCVEAYPLSADDFSEELFDVMLYPNPTKGEAILNINSSKVNDIELSIRDVTGRLILKEQYSGEQVISFNISDKPSGMYFIHLNLDGVPVTKKLILDKR